MTPVGSYLSNMRKTSANSSSDFPLLSSFIQRTIMTKNSSKSTVPLPANTVHIHARHMTWIKNLFPVQRTIFIYFVHHFLQLFLGGVLAQHPHDLPQFFSADAAVLSILHEDVKRSAELCQMQLEDISVSAKCHKSTAVLQKKSCGANLVLCHKTTTAVKGKQTNQFDRNLPFFCSSVRFSTCRVEEREKCCCVWLWSQRVS